MTAPQPSRTLLPAGGRSGGATDQREPGPESVTRRIVGAAISRGTHELCEAPPSSLSVRQCHSTVGSEVLSDIRSETRPGLWRLVERRGLCPAFIRRVRSRTRSAFQSHTGQMSYSSSIVR